MSRAGNQPCSVRDEGQRLGHVAVGGAPGGASPGVTSTTINPPVRRPDRLGRAGSVDGSSIGAEVRKHREVILAAKDSLEEARSERVPPLPHLQKRDGLDSYGDIPDRGPLRRLDRTLQ